MYPLSKHLRIICVFYSLILLGIAHRLSRCIPRPSCRLTKVSCSSPGSERLWSGLCGQALKERLRRPGQAFWCSDLKSMLPPPVCILAFILNQPGFSSEVCSMNFFCHFVLLCLLFPFSLFLPSPRPHSRWLTLSARVEDRFGLEPALRMQCLFFNTTKGWNSY